MFSFNYFNVCNNFFKKTERPTHYFLFRLFKEQTRLPVRRDGKLPHKFFAWISELEGNRKKQGEVSVCGGDRVEGRAGVPARTASLHHVKRMLSFDHFLTISPDAFLLCFVRTLCTTKYKYTHTLTQGTAHTGAAQPKMTSPLNQPLTVLIFRNYLTLIQWGVMVALTSQTLMDLINPTLPQLLKQYTFILFLFKKKLLNIKSLE